MTWMIAWTSKILIRALLNSCNPSPKTQEELTQALTQIEHIEESLNGEKTGSPKFGELLNDLNQSIESLTKIVQTIDRTNFSIPDTLIVEWLNDLKDYATFISNFSDLSSKKNAVGLFKQYQALSTQLQQQIPYNTDQFDIVIAKILSNIAATYSENPSSNYEQLLSTQTYLQQALAIRQQTGTDSTQLLINRSNVCISLASNTTDITKQAKHLLEGYNKIKPLFWNPKIKPDHKHMIANNLATIWLLRQEIATNYKNKNISIPPDINTIKDIETNYLQTLTTQAPYLTAPWYQQILKHASAHQISDQALSKKIFESLSFEDLGTISNAAQVTKTIQDIYTKLWNSDESNKYSKINSIIQQINTLFKDHLNQTTISLQRQNAELSEKRSNDILWYGLSIAILLSIFASVSLWVSKVNQQNKKKAERNIASKTHNLEQMADAMSHIVNGYASRLAGLCSLITQGLLTIEEWFLLINDMIMGPFSIAMKNLQDYSSIAQGETSQEHVESTIVDIIPTKTAAAIAKIQTQYPRLKITSISHTDKKQGARISCDAELYEKAINMVIDNAIKFSLVQHPSQGNNQDSPTIITQSKIQDNNLVITISDNGPGFDDEFVNNGIVKDIGASPSVYNIKQRGMIANAVPTLKPPYHSNRWSGNGIGLALVHQIMLAAHGKVTIRSTPQWSTVTLTFPLAKQSPSKPTQR